MSRTYRRRDHIERDCCCGAPIYSFSGRSDHEEIIYSLRKGTIPWRDCRCDTWYYDNHKRNFKRDRKDFNKANKGYKIVTKKIRKAKERSAMERRDYDNIPTFRKSNDYDIN